MVKTRELAQDQVIEWLREGLSQLQGLVLSFSCLVKFFFHLIHLSFLFSFWFVLSLSLIWITFHPHIHRRHTSYLVSEHRFHLGLANPSTSTNHSFPSFSTKLIFSLNSNMSSTSMSLEERFEALMKQNEFLASKIREDSQRNQEA